MSKIVRTYRGKPGCGCGCKGTYAEAGSLATTLRLRAVSKAMQRGEKVLVQAGSDGQGIVALENESVYLWLYFETLVDAVRWVQWVLGAPCAAIG